MRHPGNSQIQASTLYSPVVTIFTTDFNIKKTLNFGNAVQLRVQYDDHKSDCYSRNSRSTNLEWKFTVRYELSLYILVTSNRVSGAMGQTVSRRPLAEEARVRSQTSHCGDLWWTNWNWDGFFFQYFDLSLSVSFHQCSILHLHVSLTRRTRWRKPGNVPQSTPPSVIGKWNVLTCFSDVPRNPWINSIIPENLISSVAKTVQCFGTWARQAQRYFQLSQVLDS